MYDEETTEAMVLAPAQAAPAASIAVYNPIPSAGEVIQEMRDRRALLHAAMREILVDKTDYGTIPGCGDRPCLLLPGAQKLSSAFRLVPRYQVTIRDLGGHSREYDVKCLLYSHGGTLLAEGEGTCSSLETKYRYRPGPVTMTDKAVPHEYWNMRKSDPAKAQALLGGQGFVAKKAENGAWYVARKGESAENPDPADLWNTLKKMACKRAFVAAVITATNASDVFTQDIEENPDLYRRDDLPAPPASPPIKPASTAPPVPADPPLPPPPPGMEDGPVPEAPPSGDGATEKQVKAMYSLMRKCGIDVTKPEELRNASRQLGPHDAPEQFTKKEAIKAIGELNDIVSSQAGGQ